MSPSPTQVSRLQTGLLLPCPSLEHLPAAEAQTLPGRQDACANSETALLAASSPIFLSSASLSSCVCSPALITAMWRNTSSQLANISPGRRQPAAAALGFGWLPILTEPCVPILPLHTQSYSPNPTPALVAAGVFYLPTQCKYFISWCYPAESRSSLPAGQTKHALIEPRLCRNRWFDGDCWCRTRRGRHPAPGLPRK